MGRKTLKQGKNPESGSTDYDRGARERAKIETKDSRDRS